MKPTKSTKPTRSTKSAETATPTDGMTLYDTCGPRCLDCIYCGQLVSYDGDDDSDPVVRPICTINPPKAHHAWPRLPADGIAQTFCMEFTTADGLQPLKHNPVILPRWKGRLR